MKPMFRLWVEAHQRLCHVIYIDFMNRHVQVLISDDYGHEGPLDVYDVDLEALEQFTGIQDSEGVDIYEGDIIRYWVEDVQAWSPFYAVEFGYVEWGRGTDMYGYAFSANDEFLFDEKCTICGNIHQHAHLLEE